ncbi:serine dehydratase-like [Pollicipes pollicipes]|nr:serine dehydratase-like [Pollicipes pollicipes]
METEGADCFSKALEAGKPVVLSGITSLAKSLGALQVSDRLLEWSRRRPVLSGVVTDRQAVDACARLAADHRLLVEPACGVTPDMLLHWQTLTAA